MCKRLLFTTILWLALAPAASATPVWDELTNGELSDDSWTATDLGSLTAGLWTVNGSLSISQEPGESIRRDQDYFSFTIANGFELVGASLLWTQSTIRAASGSVNWLIFLPPAGPSATSDGDAFIATLPHDLPFFGGPFLTSQTINVPGGLVPPWQLNEAYTIQLDVRAAPGLAAQNGRELPEPAPVALLAASVLALAAARRRRI